MDVVISMILFFVIPAIVIPIEGVYKKYHWRQLRIKGHEDEIKIVYITRSGQHYHNKGCKWLYASRISIPEDEAYEKGYTPCSQCAIGSVSTFGAIWIWGGLLTGLIIFAASLFDYGNQVIEYGVYVFLIIVAILLLINQIDSAKRLERIRAKRIAQQKKHSEQLKCDSEYKYNQAQCRLQEIEQENEETRRQAEYRRQEREARFEQIREKIRCENQKEERKKEEERIENERQQRYRQESHERKIDEGINKLKQGDMLTHKSFGRVRVLRKDDKAIYINFYGREKRINIDENTKKTILSIN